MRKSPPTSVNLTAKASIIKKQYEPLGLKGILSVGLEEFSKLPDTEKISRVQQAIAEDKAIDHSKSSQKEALKNAVKFIKEMTEVERQQPGTIYRVLDADEQRILDDFRRVIGPKPKKTKKKHG